MDTNQCLQEDEIDEMVETLSFYAGRAVTEEGRLAAKEDILMALDLEPE